MVDSLQTLLREIVTTPEQPVGLLPLVATPAISPTQVVPVQKKINKDSEDNDNLDYH